MPPSLHCILTERSLTTVFTRSTTCTIRIPSLGLCLDPPFCYTPDPISLQAFLIHVKQELLSSHIESELPISDNFRSLAEILTQMSQGEVPFRLEFIDPLSETRFDNECMEISSRDITSHLRLIGEALSASKFQNVIVLLGAGASVSAGIPDFRSPESGLYCQLSGMGLPRPEAIFDLSYFRLHPQPFFTIAKQLWPGKGQFRPTLTHWAIRLLAEKGIVRRVYTQNIDGLERLSGIDENLLVEVHGTFDKASCIECHRPYPVDIITESFSIVLCDECQGLVKPDIVFFGEQLPQRFHLLVRTDFQHCDLLLVIGTSLSVQPCASLIDLVPETCQRLLINRDLAGVHDSLFGEGFKFAAPDSRDSFFQGDCDESFKLLVAMSGWADDLRQLMAFSA